MIVLAAAMLLAAVSRADPAPMHAWRSLLDENAAAWRGWESTTFPEGWQVAADTISKEGEVDDLVTREMFGDFELELEWKVGKGGNSGIFYRGTREYEYIFWSAPEYQLLDDANAPDGRNRLSSASAAFGLYPAPAGVVKPAGEWNTTRIVVDGAHVEHWLNGQKAVTYELWSADWNARVAASKFSAYPNYGLAKAGYISIQGDHAGALALRNVRIRKLR